jgi:hypothetical protein
MDDLEKDQQQDDMSTLHLQDLSHRFDTQSQSQSRFDTQYYQKRSVPFRSVELHFPTFLEHSEYTSLGQFDSNDDVNSQSSSLLLNSDYINAHFAEALSRSVPLPNIIEEDEGGNDDNEDNDEDEDGNDVFV